ncbi:hypothetical protein NDU88_002932 [Pleurodeles waltl]|uniref:Uncharacterized protein n=1 Tax=Pleurodeles waltl TaxID=8319 RepID=A0AAV7TMM3_PLEWA|nr:hypothetical protein NDU88_002932 [Pleurodeles waltl]
MVLADCESAAAARCRGRPRAYVAPPRPGATRRAIVARLLNYRDYVLRAARDSDKAVFENGKISIYPDYTNKVQNS